MPHFDRDRVLGLINNSSISLKTKQRHIDSRAGKLWFMPFFIRQEEFQFRILFFNELARFQLGQVQAL